MVSRRHIVLFCLLWTCTVLTSLIWSIYSINENTLQIVHNIGRAFFREIETTRLWNARHGGVYVPVTEETQPNPYLKVPDRDITTTDGKRLTMVNPAYMTRQIAEIAEEYSQVRYHITSRDPVRPGNRADAWESRALQQFENGQQELLERIPDSAFFRYMAPLEVKAACLPCHADQGYRLGEIRGGISVTIPGEVYLQTANESKIKLIGVHLAFLTAGIFGILRFIRVNNFQINLIYKKNLALKRQVEKRKRVEDSLIEAKQAAEEASLAKSRFLANMSHEIRTPLNAVLGFATILEEQIRDHRHRRYISLISAAGNTLLRLINDILDLSRIEAGKLEINYEPVDIRMLIREIESIFSIEFEKKGLAFIPLISPDVPARLLLDEIRIRQILLNLVGNAVKFTDSGYVKVSAFLRNAPAPARSESPPSDLILNVADSGIGIPEDQQEKIFGDFEQREGQSVHFGGTGLGLAISRRLVEMMNGTISVSGAEGKGSTFTIVIRNVARVDGQPEATKERPADAGEIVFSGGTLLIVDDVADNRELLAGYLTSFEFQIIEAENGKQAVDLAQQYRPDLILMDMKMPVMDGWQATRQIKAGAGTASIPVIAVTASAMKNTELHIRKVCDGYIRKPVERDVLLREISRFLPHTVSAPPPPEPAAIPETEGRTSKVTSVVPELICDLETVFLPKWKELSRFMIMDELEGFAAELNRAADAYAVPGLHEYSRRLQHEITAYDISGIKRTMQCFPEIIERIKTGNIPASGEMDGEYGSTERTDTAGG